MRASSRRRFPPAITPRISRSSIPSDVSGTVAGYEDYPELFVRWFEWGAFHPVMRAHGEREHNEVWSYGKQAEPILAKYLRLRYQLLPYTYSLAYGSYQTGAPFMRALFMDFRNDPKVVDIARRIYVRARIPCRPGDGAGRDQPQGLPARRLLTGTTTGQTSA